MAWWQEAVFYQIYPRSFLDTNGDGVGDLNGIRQKLDYLEALGVDALWISPIFPSPMRDFGYDVSDYCNVDALFGSLDDLTALTYEVHSRGMRIILDWVPNHTSSDHPWFQESRSSRENPKRDWYVWRERPADGALPNNWIRAWSDQSVWTLDDQTDEYFLHCFLESQPDLNWDNVEVREAMKETLRFWLRLGIDGFRMDVIHLIGKELNVDDDPALAALSHVPLNDVARTHDYLREIRRVLDEFDDRVAVGEVYLFDPDRVAQYYGQGDELHMSFNFASIMTPWRASAWADLIRITEATHLSSNAWPTWVLSNHDNRRLASRVGEDPAKIRAALLLLLTLRGTPFLYAGEELGLPDAIIPHDRVVDPGGRDGCRAPIPWTTEAHGGWPVTPWLPSVEDAADRSVESQLTRDDSFLATSMELLTMRRNYRALRLGELTNLNVRDEVLCFERVLDYERIAIRINFSDVAVASFDADVVRTIASSSTSDHIEPGGYRVFQLA